MKTIYLSHTINEQTPLYGGEKAISIELRSEISKGASSNTKFLHFPNHTGTHIDFPNHFSETGKTINDYPADFWIFGNVFVLEYDAEPNEMITSQKLKLKDIPETTEFLILKTGFEKFRREKTYWNNNPGLSPGLACSLKNRCPDLKVVGFDFISVSSYQNRQLGRKAHKEFLIENDTLLIEDMMLDGLEKRNVKSIIALPLMIDKVDGVPITIIAEIS